MKFSDLRLIEPLLRSLSTENYHTATPIQAKAIPHVLDGHDLLGSAQTGTGKTAAFALPILQRLSATPIQAKRHVRALVLCPTRELATQIADSFRVYGRHLQLRHATIFGGVNQNPQVEAVRRGVDILIATPGRLLDLIEQRHIDLRHIEVLVLDEADRMLDMGFIHDIRRIVSQIPGKRQTLMFSATMPTEIRKLADTLLRNPISVQVAAVSTPVETIDQSVYFVDKKNKPILLAHLYNHLPMARAIVFTRTKHGADRVVRHLHTRGIRAEAIHGNKSQNARNRALENFKACKTPVLVATDIASRGIDVDGITHVVNYDLTHEPETYVHRIGRTARAGASGSAVSFCDREERSNLKAIESLIRRSIPVKDDHPTYPAENTNSQPAHAKSPQHRRPQAQQAHSNQHPARETRGHHPRSEQSGNRASATATPPRASHAPAHHAQPAPAGKPTHARHPLARNGSGRSHQGNKRYRRAF